VEHALCCLNILKDHALFASNTASELQEIIKNQKNTIELLEKNFLDQKQEAEQLKQQVQTLTNSNCTSTSTDTTKCLFSTDRVEVGQESDSEEKRPPSPVSFFPKSLPSVQNHSSIIEKEDLFSTPNVSDLIGQRTTLLKKGSFFVKYGRRGSPHMRFVWFTDDLEYLQYRKVGQSTPSTSIPTRSFTRVLIGQQTQVFHRFSKKEKDIFCFSLEYQVTSPEKIRTIDLEVSYISFVQGH
jgi:hypothetical protein